MMSTTNKRSKSVKGQKFLIGQKQIVERESAGYNPDNIQLTHKRCDICRLNHIKPENEELFKKKYWVKYCRNCYKKNGHLATSCIQCGKHTFSAPKKPRYDFAEHSDEMWAIHNEVIKKGRLCPDHHKEETIWTYPDWTARESPHRECIWNDTVPGPHLHDREHIPIDISCSNENCNRGMCQFCNGIGKVTVGNKGKNECPKCEGEGYTANPLSLGSIEYENADILGSMCLVCFRDVTGQEEVELCKTGSVSSDEYERRMHTYTPQILTDWKSAKEQFDVWYYPKQQKQHEVLKEFQKKVFHQQNCHPAFEGLRKQIRKKVGGGSS